MTARNSRFTQHRWPFFNGWNLQDLWMWWLSVWPTLRTPEAIPVMARKNTWPPLRGKQPSNPYAFLQPAGFSLPPLSSLSFTLPKVDKAQLVTQAQIVGVGMGVGLVTKLAFVAAATSLTIPGGIAIPAAVLVAGAASNLSRVWVKSLIKGEKLEKGWRLKAIKQGLIAGAVGGFIGAEIAQHFPIHAISAFAHRHVWFLQSHQTQQLATHPPLPTKTLPPSLAAAPSLLAVTDLTHSPGFDQLSPDLQRLGQHAMHSSSQKVMLHFYKEASFQLMNGPHHTAATRAMGVSLLKTGATLARNAGMHDINARMLMRDEDFLNGIHTTLANAPHAATPFIPSSDPFISSSDYGTSVHGQLTSLYGERIDPLLGIPKMHWGMDVGAPRGTPIHALVDGTVEKVAYGYNHGFGNAVQIDPDGVRKTMYGHMSGFAKHLHPGMHVNKGQIIGYVGATGRTNGHPNVHFGCKEFNRWVNPTRCFANKGAIAGLIVG